MEVQFLSLPLLLGITQEVIMRNNNIMKKLDKAELIKHIVFNYCPGIYPQAVVKDGVETKRTEWQNGWNECAMAYLKGLSSQLKYIETLDEKVLRLVMSGSIIIGENNQLQLMLNDTFFYATADYEVIESTEMPELIRLSKMYGLDGEIYWAAKKRGYDPDPEMGHAEGLAKVREQEEKLNA